MKRKAVVDKMRQNFEGIVFLLCWENCLVSLMRPAMNISP